MAIAMGIRVGAGRDTGYCNTTNMRFYWTKSDSSCSALRTTIVQTREWMSRAIVEGIYGDSAIGGLLHQIA